MIHKEKVIVLDIDGTLCGPPELPGDYLSSPPYMAMIEKIRELSSDGFYIILSTSRQMRTFEGNLGKINASTLPTLIEWLKKHDVPYDEIHVGKPWCGKDSYYVDDKAVRPIEFLTMSHLELNRKLESEKETLNRFLAMENKSR